MLGIMFVDNKIGWNGTTYLKPNGLCTFPIQYLGRVVERLTSSDRVTLVGSRGVSILEYELKIEYCNECWS